MINKKIIRMISQMGEMKIDSLMSWYPLSERNEIEEIVKSSNELTLIGDVVSLRKDVEQVEAGLTKEAIIQLIAKYNEKISAEFTALTSDPEKMKIDTVITFLEKKYILENYLEEDKLHIFVQTDKETSSNKGYAVLVSELTSEEYEKIDSLFENETVFIYYINGNEYGECSTTKDFYIKSCEAILNEFMVDYRIDTETIVIKSITTIGGNR